MGTKLKNVSQLSNLEVDLVVAYLQRIEVEVFNPHEQDSRYPATEQHVAQRFAFDPEGPANYFSRDHRTMWRFYEPTKDWAIAGPIIQEERIWICHGADDWHGKSTPYCWTFYANEDGDVERHTEYDADTALESAMRSYIAKHLGDTIDVYNLPRVEHPAIVHVSGFKSQFINFDEGNYLEVEEHLVKAATKEEAERLALADFPEYQDIDANFIRWA